MYGARHMIEDFQVWLEIDGHETCSREVFASLIDDGLTLTFAEKGLPTVRVVFERWDESESNKYICKCVQREIARIEREKRRKEVRGRENPMVRYYQKLGLRRES